MNAILRLEAVSKAYGAVPVLANVSLSVTQGDFAVVYGLPSSGKTTLMRLLAGLETPDTGDIFLRGVNVRGVPPQGRNVGYVPQDFALYPHRNVLENIAYPLRLMGKRPAEIEEVVRRAANMLSIEDLLQKLPTQLSGGQKQRVAIARGIAKETDIYLLDDPLAGLDFKLREKLIDDLKDLQEELGACFVYTTSDPIESLGLANTIAVLHDHRIRETGSPQTVYGNPVQLSTMDILGFPRSNLLDARLHVTPSGVWCETGLFDFPVDLEPGVPDKAVADGVVAGIRPESIAEASHDTEDGVLADIYLREDLGSEEIVYLSCGARSLTMLDPRRHSGQGEVGDRIRIRVTASDVLVFERESGTRIARGR